MNRDETESSIKWKKWIQNPIFLGIIIGFLAALFQALVISAGGPEAYGFCVACHTRDFINGVINKIAGNTILGLAPISANSWLPSLSILGVILGAFISAKYHKEFRIKKSSWQIYALYFLGGIFVLIFALLLGGCPYRAALRVAYGDLVALIGIISMGLGVFVGVKILLHRMNKQMEDVN